ncbi:hypothetical protein RB195_004326 [Necator americanus]|uniref:Methyltransferase domain protein n=1 Tax=Necator americanus TaxID=51031 RepID=A0ABR1BLE9_NECAM
MVVAGSEDRFDSNLPYSASSSSHQFNMLPLTVWTFLCTLVPLTMSSEFSCTHDGKPSDVCDREDYETISDRDAAGYFIHNYGYRRNLEKSVCLNDGDCVDIADGVVYYNDRYNFARGILMGQLLISRAYLKLPKKPENYDYEIFDTSRWAINKTSLDFFSYTTTMIEEMFASGAVDISREVTAQVLSIGIGGGFINTYLHYNYPNMNITAVDVEPKTLEIAQKWFALELDQRHHVVIMDGIKFIEQAVNEGQKYDAIHIDACTTDQSAELACPLVAFLKPEVVKNLSKLLTKKGVVIMNVISLHGKIQESAKRVRTSFQKFFKVCSIKLAPYSQLNLVATCGQYPRPESLKEKYIEFAKYPPAAYYKDEFP